MDRNEFVGQVETMQKQAELFAICEQTEARIGLASTQLDRHMYEQIAGLEAIVAEQATALAAARAAQQAAERAGHDREALLAMVAQELKPALTAIIDYTQILQKRITIGDTLKSRDLRGLRMIADSARQLSTIVDLLEDVACSDADHLNGTRTPPSPDA